jgi:hypothetical protein
MTSDVINSLYALKKENFDLKERIREPGFVNP